MTLTFYGHRLASYCHKVLVALYETGAPFTFRELNPGDPADRALIGGLTPLGKMPALRDEARGVTVAESSLIIEYLDRHYPGSARLIPDAEDAAREVHLWDRIFDAHVHAAFQPIVDARLFMDPAVAPGVTAYAHTQLDRAYAALDRHLDGREWAAGDFSLADCAAAPALFYACVLHPFDGYPNLSAYFDRLTARPSVARVLAEARPWFDYFPFKDRIPARFLG